MCCEPFNVLSLYPPVTPPQHYPHAVRLRWYIVGPVACVRYTRFWPERISPFVSPSIQANTVISWTWSMYPLFVRYTLLNMIVPTIHCTHACWSWTESFLSLSKPWTRYEHWHAIDRSTGIPLQRCRAIPDDLFICFLCVFPCSQYMSRSCTVHILALGFRRSTCLPVETPMQCLNTYRRLPPIWPGCWGNVRRSRPPRSNCPFRHCLLRLFAIADFIAKKIIITFWQSTNLNEKLHCPFRHVDDAQVLWISIQGLFWPRLPRWGSSLPGIKLKADHHYFDPLMKLEAALRGYDSTTDDDYLYLFFWFVDALHCTGLSCARAWR